MESAVRWSQVIQGFIQSGIQKLQGWRLHNLSRKHILLGFLSGASFVFSCISSCVVLFLILSLQYLKDYFKITIRSELSPFRAQRLRSPFGAVPSTSFVLCYPSFPFLKLEHNITFTSQTLVFQLFILQSYGEFRRLFSLMSQKYFLFICFSQWFFLTANSFLSPYSP